MQQLSASLLAEQRSAADDVEENARAGQVEIFGEVRPTWENLNKKIFLDTEP